MLDEKTEAFKLAFSGIIGAAITRINANYKYVTVLIILIILDIVFGWLKSFKLRNFEARIARWSLTSKLVELLLVYILSLLDWAFNINGLLGNVGVLYYMIVETASIIENIYDGGLAVLPPGLVELVRKLKYSAGKALVKKLWQTFSAAIGVDEDKSNEEK